MAHFRIILFASLIIAIAALPAHPWSNGAQGNTLTDVPSECANPPYSTHDWVADHALALLPANEQAWLTPHKRLYLLGTEAPDNSGIPTECGAPNTGYNDRGQGHSVEWNSDWSGWAERDGQIQDRAARRAQEEYNKAVAAFDEGNLPAAAFYLGAMSHYLGDVMNYAHSIRTLGTYVCGDRGYCSQCPDNKYCLGGKPRASK